MFQVRENAWFSSTSNLKCVYFEHVSLSPLSVILLLLRFFHSGTMIRWVQRFAARQIAAGRQDGGAVLCAFAIGVQGYVGGVCV